MSNIMKEVASALDVELGERFAIKDLDGEWYLAECGMVNSAGKGAHNGILTTLITGDREIVKIPWSPERWERYCYWEGKANCWWEGISEESLTLSFDEWENRTLDLERLAMGNCFRTEGKAQANKDKVIAVYEAILNSLHTDAVETKK